MIVFLFVEFWWIEAIVAQNLKPVLSANKITPALETLDRVIAPLFAAACLVTEHAIDHGRATIVTPTWEVDVFAVAVVGTFLFHRPSKSTSCLFPTTTLCVGA
jgi:hypothetical protein